MIISIISYIWFLIAFLHDWICLKSWSATMGRIIGNCRSLWVIASVHCQLIKTWKNTWTLEMPMLMAIPRCQTQAPGLWHQRADSMPCTGCCHPHALSQLSQGHATLSWMHQSRCPPVDHVPWLGKTLGHQCHTFGKWSAGPAFDQQSWLQGHGYGQCSHAARRAKWNLKEWYFIRSSNRSCFAVFWNCLEKGHPADCKGYHTLELQIKLSWFLVRFEKLEYQAVCSVFSFPAKQPLQCT